MPGGVTYEDYLPSSLAPLPDQDEVKVATVASPDSNNATPNVQEVSEVAEVSGGVSGGVSMGVSGGTPATDKNADL